MNEDETPRPPYSADLLAELHAGALDEEVAAELWPSVRRDADAMTVIAALDAVQTRLGELRAAPAAEPIPPEVRQRIEAALAAQSRHRRAHRSLRVGAGIAAAAVLVAGMGLLAVRWAGSGDDTAAPVAAGPAAEPEGGIPAGATGADPALDPAALRSLVGRTGLGPLSDPVRLEECLAANGFDDTATVLGSSEIRIGGAPAVALLLPGPRIPQLTALVVGTDCSTTDPATVSVTVLG